MFIKAEMHWWHVLISFQPFKFYSGHSCGLHLALGARFATNLIVDSLGIILFISNMVPLFPLKDTYLIQTFKECLKTYI